MPCAEPGDVTVLIKSAQDGGSWRLGHQYIEGHASQRRRCYDQQALIFDDVSEWSQQSPVEIVRARKIEGQHFCYLLIEASCTRRQLQELMTFVSRPRILPQPEIEATA